MKTALPPRPHIATNGIASGPLGLLCSITFPLLAGAGLAPAAPADLDPTFGTAGRLVFEQSSQVERWNRVVPLPSGDVLVSGWTGTDSDTVTGRYIVKVNKDGSPVTSFGTAGQATLSFGSGDGRLEDIIMQPDGKILAVARERSIRLLSDGTLDTSFAVAPGGYSIALAPDGKIILLGGSNGGTGVTVTRLTSEGYLDHTFSHGGTANLTIGVRAWTLGMTTQPDGRIILVGYISPDMGESSKDLLVVRLLADGSLDSTFASGGKFVLDVHGNADEAWGVCLRPSGKMVVFGGTIQGNSENSLFVGLKQDGTLDPTFGTGGIAEIDAGTGNDRATAATLMPDGRIIASTMVSISGGMRFAAIRLMPDGIPDPTFALGGVVQISGTETLSGGSDWTWNVARDRAGHIFIIGGADNQSGHGGLLVRLKGDPDTDGDGVVDLSESNTGIFISPFDTGTNPANPDTDSDGLNDGAEVNQYGSNPLVADTDLDGFLDGYEVLTGKSPLDINDHPALVAEARTAIEFTFPAAVGKTYRIEASTDLVTWQIVETGIAGTGGQIQRFYSTRGQPKSYFRVEEVAP
ncbi:MAG: hypothetical protein K9N23_02815 [Akkermansiaceae bacterium]|nr:hypothetical protein [Akkermansiaceae bacterium]MCF7730585.1 hypothetical protein [Akkermansiaceae bacterium]